MQVYLVSRPGQDLTTADAFRNFTDIEPSLRISYSAFDNVKIKSEPMIAGGPKFTVTGSNDGIEFTEELLVTRFAVYDSPTHL